MESMENNMDQAVLEQPPQEEIKEERPKKLVALHPILYLSRQYKVGETLPANDPVMLEAWLEARTAAWVEEAVAAPSTAKPRAAQAGLPGDAVSSDAEDGENLAGRVPGTRARRKK